MEPLAIPADPRPLGRSGLHARPIAWSFRPNHGATPAQVAAALHAARGAGVGLVTLSDHPAPASRDPFGHAETLFGAALAQDPAARGDLLVALRVGVRPGPVFDARPHALAAALDHSLERLGLAAVDLLLLQRPDDMTPASEIARALDALVASGKVRAVGLANHRATEARAILAHLDAPLACLETPFSLLDPAPLQAGLLDFAQEEDIAVLAGAPLAEGQLGDRPDMAGSVTARASIRALDAIAGQQGVSRAAVAGAFVALHASRAIPVFGTQDPAELAHLADLFRVRLTRADWYRLLESALGHRLPTTEADR